MKADGPRGERETVINFNEEDDTCSIWTASDVTYRHLLKRLGSEYVTQDGERHAEFKFPVKWLTLPRKRVVRPLTEAQKAALVQKFSKSRAPSGD